MSVVTNIVVFAECGEPKTILDSLGFREISGSAGGNKSMEAMIYAAAFNHLDLHDAVYRIMNAGWEWPESVQIFAKEQEAEAFTQCAKGE